MMLYYILIPLLSIVFGVGLFFLFKLIPNKKNLILKILAVALFFVMLVRYQSGIPAIASTRGLNMYSPFGDDILKTTIGLLLPWFTYAVLMLLVLNLFFEMKTIKNIIKFFGIPVLILDILLFKTNCLSIVPNAFDGFHLRTFLMAVEIIMSLGLIGSCYIDKSFFKLNKKDVRNLFIVLPFVLLAIMPGYTLQGLIGFRYTMDIKVKEFTQAHRTLLYFSVIIPVAIYFALRGKDDKTRRFSMIYLSLAAMWTFMIRFDFARLSSSPVNWPLHLCNTAMYIVPICLIFKFDKLFYFTFFINVMGAFLAMAMPNTSDTANLLSETIYNFWINHFCAFFMPVLLVALKQFRRPRAKEWAYSLIAFFAYFVFILIINAWFSNYGDVDFFFLNSDFILDKLGEKAKHIRDITWTFNVKNMKLVFYPLYQFLFFLVYVAITIGIWFLYEVLFQTMDISEDRKQRNYAFAQIEKELREIRKLREERGIDMSNVEPSLVLKNFTKRYGTSDIYAVKDASLSVKAGTIFGFLGHNGAGKSTIIKSIVGIQKITEGSIEVCGYDVEKEPVEAKKEIGFVPDHYALYENLTGREYINYIADLYGVSQEDRDARIKKYLDLFRLHDAFDNQMKTYSHGMKQKVTIISALVHNPKVWILDEPLTGLDPDSIFQVKECMKQHAKEGNIVFFSSHIIDLVERVCDHIAIISHGHILCETDVKDIEKAGKTLEQFYMEANEKAGAILNEKVA